MASRPASAPVLEPEEEEEPLTRESAKEAFVQWLYDRISTSDVFQRVATKLRVGQRWGVWLVLADAASRDYRHVVQKIADNTKVSIRWIAPPAAAQLAMCVPYPHFTCVAKRAPSGQCGQSSQRCHAQPVSWVARASPR